MGAMLFITACKSIASVARSYKPVRGHRGQGLTRAPRAL
jgi:hypothetical protein